MTKIVHVHLIYEKKNLYFGSISAIFESLTEEQVGITKSSLLHAGLTDGTVKYTKRAMIIQSHLIKTTRKKQKPLKRIKSRISRLFLYPFHSKHEKNPFERFKQLKKREGVTLGVTFGVTKNSMEKRNVLNGVTFGVTFCTAFDSYYCKNISLLYADLVCYGSI